MSKSKLPLKRKEKILTICLLSIVLGFWIFNYWGPRLIIQVNGLIFSTLRPINKENIPISENLLLKTKRFNIKTADNLNLSGILIRTDSLNQKGTVILVHGIRAHKEHFLPVCKLLSDNGFNSVIIDLRAHGESQGEFCTFGYYEKQDLKILIDTLFRFNDLNKNFGIWGQSLGGAVSMQVLAIDKRLKYGIIESTFSDFNSIVHDYFRYHIGFDIPFLSNYLIWRAEKIGSFDSDSIKPSESAKLITQPIMIVHGKKDKRIKYEYDKINFSNLASFEKEFMEIPEADHLNVWKIGGDAYLKKVINFLNKQTNE